MQVSRRTAAACWVFLLGIALAACGGQTPSPKPKNPHHQAAATLHLVVYGPAEVVKTYKQLASDFAAQENGVSVEVTGYATHEEALNAVEKDAQDGSPPDVFLGDVSDLRTIRESGLTQPVDSLLGARSVDFGDGYQRTGLEAFSGDNNLTCMPETVSPMVVYYNKSLIDLNLVRPPGANPIDPEKGWKLDDFATAARLGAARPGVKGFYIAPTLEQVAPFVWSAGGDLVDDPKNPTSLTLSDGSSTRGLQDLLALTRDPSLTYVGSALPQSTVLRRFESGRLAMMLGFRDLTPELRRHSKLDFDVMPLPRESHNASRNEMSGLCISRTTPHRGRAADLVTSLVSNESAERLAQTGYVVPANLDVLQADDFLQLGQRPAHASVFARSVHGSRVLPDPKGWPVVAAQVDAALSRLFTDPVIDPLDQRLEAIDKASKPLLAPPSPMPTPSEGASEGAPSPSQ